jgi:hypothetical protein
MLLRLASLIFVLCHVSAWAETEKDSEAPMTFAHVRFGSPSCAPTCPEWISAEGKITGSTPALFRKFLSSRGKAQLPIIIQSSGGDIDAAMQMGRMIRKKKLDVSVGWTLLSKRCIAPNTCSAAEWPKGVSAGLAFSARAYCNSACSLVLAAGVHRMAGTISSVGVHQPHTNWTKGDTIYYREKYRMVGKKKIIISRKEVKRVKGKAFSTDGFYKGLRKKMTSYLSDMGVSVSLIAFMEKAPNSSIYWMSADDLTQTQLTNRVDSTEGVINLLTCKTLPLKSHCITFNAAETAKHE